MVAREQHVDISKLLTTYKLFIKVVDPLVQICSLVAIIFRWDYPRLNIAMLVYSCISCFILYKVQLFVQLLFLMFAVCLGLLHARTGLLGKVLPMGQRATHRPSNGPSNDPSNVNIPSTTTSSTQPPTRLRQRRGETTGSRAACSPASSASSPGTASSATTTATPAPPGTGSASLSSTSTTATPSSVSTSHGQRSPCTQHKFQQQIDDFKLLLYNLNSNLEIAVNIIECSYNVIKWEVYSHSILFYTSLSIVLIGLNTLPLRYTVNACFIVLLCCQPFIHAYRNRMGAHSKKAHSPTGAHCDPSSAPTSTPSQSPLPPKRAPPSQRPPPAPSSHQAVPSSCPAPSHGSNPPSNQPCTADTTTASMSMPLVARLRTTASSSFADLDLTFDEDTQPCPDSESDPTSESDILPDEEENETSRLQAVAQMNGDFIEEANGIGSTSARMLGRILEYKRKKNYPTPVTCALCSTSLSTILRRKRKCANCANFYCSQCCNERVPKSMMGVTSPLSASMLVLVCATCYKQLNQSSNAAAPAKSPK